MIVVGLTGSIAMGKTETAKLFAARGIPVFDSDAAVHRLYASGGKAVAAIAAIAPEAVTDGAVDRALLSREIAKNPEILRQVERAVHPLVRAMREEFLAAAKLANQPIAVVDSPLLFETGEEDDVDKIVVVTASADKQRARALSRPGMTGEKFDFILSQQMPDAAKRRKADYIVDTSVSISGARLQVNRIIADLLE